MEQVNRLLLQVLAAFSAAAALTAVIVGCAVLAGWTWDVEFLKSVLPGLPTMKANTALCFVGSGLSMLLWQRAGATNPGIARPALRIALLLASAVSIVAALTLVEYITGWNSGLDELVFRDAQTAAAHFPGRMSVATAFNFLLIGGALLLYCNNRLTAVAQSFSAVATIIALVALLAYLFHADLQRAHWFSSVAVHTAATFLFLGGGLLNLKPREGWMREFVLDTISARLGRIFLAGTLLVLPLLAELRILGQRNLELYGTYFGIAILTVASMVILSLLNWFSTRTGNDAEEKISNHTRVYATLSDINQLIVRVHNREQLFAEACKIAYKTGLFPWAWIATVDEAENQVTLAAWQGTDETMLEGLKHRLSLDPGAQGEDGLVRKAIDSKRPVVLNNIAGFSRTSDSDLLRNRELLDRGILSLALLPLVVSGKAAGIFALHAQESDFFDEQEMNLLIEMAGDISFAIDNIRKEETLNYLAYYDQLTGLANRSLFVERLGREIANATRSGRKVVLVLGDLKRFRMINETFGRNAADELLKQVAVRLRDHAEYPDNLARLYGGCFASFIPSNGYNMTAHRLDRLLNNALQSPFVLAGQSIRIEATLGISVFPDDGTNAEILITNTEAALAQAKENGENYLFYKSEINAAVSESLKLENKLRQALELGQFVLHYQPKTAFDQRTVESVEALIRWNDPDTGLVPPGKFIGLMEEIGLIKQAGIWALRQAVTDITRWQSMGLNAPRVAVNVSALQLRDPGFADTVIGTLQGFGSNEPLLDIEITESLIMEDVAATSVSLKTLRDAGVRVFVDDFGTGYSSLAYLARLPINALKIDRAFINGMNESEQGIAIVESIITLAHSLRLTVIAEGVETEEQADTLRKLECDLMQGYLFSKPLPFDELAAMLPRA